MVTFGSEACLITAHAAHQIEGFTLLNHCSVDSSKVQGCMHCQSVSSDQSAKCRGIRQEYRMSTQRRTNSIGAAPWEYSLLNNIKPVGKLKETLPLENFFCLSYWSWMTLQMGNDIITAEWLVLHVFSVFALVHLFFFLVLFPHS